jgi:hypothetical protein
MDNAKEVCYFNYPIEPKIPYEHHQDNGYNSTNIHKNYPIMQYFSNCGPRQSVPDTK